MPDRKERALFAAAAENYSRYYIKSFRGSGYGDEGIMYWGYGFSHYVEMREQLWYSTNGKLDLYDDPKVRNIALFGFQFAMLPGMYADFGDEPYKAVGAWKTPYLASIDRAFSVGIFEDDTAIIRSGMREIFREGSWWASLSPRRVMTKRSVVANW
jgi:hypothetical protein